METQEDKGGRSKLLIVALIVCGTLCLGIVPLVGVVAAIAIPNFISMQMQAKRAEVPANLNGIKTALIAYESAFDVYVPVSEPVPRPVDALNDSVVQWVSGTGFDTLGWYPDGDVRGTYWIELTDDGEGFIAHGMCDMDKDGVPAHYTATRSTSAVLVSPPDTY